MKIVLSILFFFLMASHVLVLSHPKLDEVQLAQDSGEDNDNGTNDERLEEKEFLPHPAYAGLSTVFYKQSFPICFIPSLASPALETQTPPPDRA